MFIYDNIGNFAPPYWLGVRREMSDSGSKVKPYSWENIDDTPTDIFGLFAGCTSGLDCLWASNIPSANGKDNSEPNGGSAGAQQCVAMNHRSMIQSNRGAWRDAVCSSLYHFVCKWSAQSTTTTTSTTATTTTTTTTTPSPVPAVSCPRASLGAGITQSRTIYSTNGVLAVNFTYNKDTTSDPSGLTRFCYMMASGNGPATQASITDQSPTLRLRPGDRLELTLINTQQPVTDGVTIDLPPALVCGSNIMDSTSTNMHFHGTHVHPTCHKDNSAYTLINGGQTFTFSIPFPADHAPGMYWYHPHVHGLSEAAVMGGASGVLIVDGMESVFPAVAGLPEQLLVIRDQLVGSHDSNRPESEEHQPGSDEPAVDVSVNFVQVLYPQYIPAVLTGLQPDTLVFWRVLNAGAMVTLNLRLVYDGVTEPAQLVAKDGVPLPANSNRWVTELPLATGERIEFIARTPKSSVVNAMILTDTVESGPDGDPNPGRPLLRIVTSPPVVAVPAPSFLSLLARTVVVNRVLYFSQRPVDPTDPDSDTVFFITVDGQQETAYNIDSITAAPAIVAKQGTVEEWLIENRSGENHVFHIHQIHFLVTAINGVAVNPDALAYQDSALVGFWDGSGPYPSLRMRLDFRGETVGDFVYHCHILEHEDKGMMAKIRVVE